MSSPLTLSSEWTFDLLKEYYDEISKMADEFKLDTYPNQIEIITVEQMMEAIASNGMPLLYHHWTFGKQYLNLEKNYKRGHMGLSYEIVINSNPCISYLLEENTLPMQALVMAHAAFGHNSFFKNNYLFQAWTSADSIIDYLVFAKNYIAQCEERYGVDAVEELLDSVHSLSHQAVDRYKRSPPLSPLEEKERLAEREEYLQSQVNTLWKTLPKKRKSEKNVAHFPKEPEENILYFIEKHAPLLEPWQREIVRIVRKIAQYFYPQRQTKVMNEGWASFWHYTLINGLYDKGLLQDRFMVEFLHHHTNVIYQPAFDSPQYSGLNPYTLGFSIFQDIRRISENPTEEDKHWFPDLVKNGWRDNVEFAMKNFKDESFIAQYLSPKVIRDLKLFSLLDEDNQENLSVSAIHDEEGYQTIREILSQQYNLSSIDPNIQIYEVDGRKDRSLTLRYYPHLYRPLAGTAGEVLKHVYKLWGFPVKLESVNDKGDPILIGTCP